MVDTDVVNEKSPGTWGISVITPDGDFSGIVSTHPEISGHLNASLLFFLRSCPPQISAVYLTTINIDRFSINRFRTSADFSLFSKICISNGLRIKLDKLSLSIQNRDLLVQRIREGRRTGRLSDLFPFLSMIDRRSYAIHEAATELETAISMLDYDFSEQESDIILKFIEYCKDALVSDVF